MARSSTWALRTAGVISASGDDDEEVDEEFSFAEDGAAAEAAIDRGNGGGVGLCIREILLLMPPL